MDIVETRELRYFVALAEELHFGRAANRIGITQPPLSRAIRTLERRLGVELVQRNSHQVTLTPAGHMLHREAKAILDAVAAAVRRTRRAARPGPTLRLAVKAGGEAGLLADILAAFDRTPEAVPVELRFCGVGEQADLVRSGAADVALMHRTRGAESGLSGVETTELLTERQVVILPRTHRLADRSTVSVRDLAGETLPRWPHHPLRTATGPPVRDASQLMELIALGRTIAVVSESVRRHLRGDLTTVPVVDAPDSVLLVAWGDGSRSAVVAAFVRAAQAAAAQAAERAAEPRTLATG